MALTYVGNNFVHGTSFLGVNEMELLLIADNLTISATFFIVQRWKNENQNLTTVLNFDIKWKDPTLLILTFPT